MTAKVATNNQARTDVLVALEGGGGASGSDVRVPGRPEVVLPSRGPGQPKAVLSLLHALIVVRAAVHSSSAQHAVVACPLVVQLCRAVVAADYSAVVITAEL